MNLTKADLENRYNAELENFKAIVDAFCAVMTANDNDSSRIANFIDHKRKMLNALDAVVSAETALNLYGSTQP